MRATQRVQRVAPAAAAAAVTIALAVGGALPAGAAGVSEPVVEGLVGPLGLAIGNDGTMYVAESFAGRVTAISKKGTRSVLAQTGGAAVSGVDAGGKGQSVFTSTVAPEEGPAEDTTLESVTPNGRTRTLASLQAYEEAHNPDGEVTYGFADAPADCLAQLPPDFQPYTGIVESNPHAVAIVPGGHLVADAAGNSIVRVAANGTLSTVAVLPPVPNVVTEELAGEFGLPGCLVGETYWGEPVPTDIEVGPDGHYYVSSLPGGPELPGSGSVFKIDSGTGAVSQVATGFSGAVDLAVAADGTIYVAELFAGQISKVVDGTVSTVVALDSPGAIEVTRDGTIYATTGVFGPSGSVVVVTP